MDTNSKREKSTRGTRRKKNTRNDFVVDHMLSLNAN